MVRFTTFVNAVFALSESLLTSLSCEYIANVTMYINKWNSLDSNVFTYRYYMYTYLLIILIVL